MTAPTYDWRVEMQHTHCARCQTFADKAISNATLFGSLGSAYEEVEWNNEVTHAARVERDPIPIREDA